MLNTEKNDFQISSLIGVPHVRGQSLREGADCWGLVELAYWHGRGIVLPPYNIEVLGGSLRDSIRAVQRHIRGEVQRAWRKLEEDEVAAPYDVVTMKTIVPEDHVAIVIEEPRLILSTSEEMGSSYLREWQRGSGIEQLVCGVYRYVGCA